MVQANNSARIGNAPKSSNGRRPHVFARCPAHGDMIATITWGTMIKAETMSEERASLLYMREHCARVCHSHPSVRSGTGLRGCGSHGGGARGVYTDIARRC
jgi:hypothetical protein